MATMKAMDEAEMRRQIVAIQTDAALSEAEKAQKRQALLSKRWQPKDDSTDEQGGSQGAGKDSKGPAATLLDESLQCTMCMDLCNRPVTAPCQHNFCLGCFTKWTNQGKKTCPTCRHPFPAKFASNPRINTALAGAIRMAKLGVRRPDASKAYVRIDDKDRPEEAFTTERAVRAGRANAASGRIMVTIPSDWFGPIPPEHDPIRGTVGEFWKDRLDCRQWGAHFPHVAGIAGQGGAGAQSVVISGGYEDDQDEGEWFLYTGSGGRDLSGNKRVTNVQSFDQTFDRYNQALQVSCLKGLPVRVIRSYKEKRSAYAPPEAEPVRYDGIYRVVRAYRKPGNQGKLVCRYLFIRCDNSPAPWSSEDQGDGPWNGELPPKALAEIAQADDGEVFEMAADPWWDYNAETKQWGWSREPPVSTKQGGSGTLEGKPARRKVTEHERALKEFNCKLCSGVLKQPLSTPCGHHFCKPCLERVFEGVGDVENRTQTSGRALRERKIAKPCPTCKSDIAEFLSKAQINWGMIDAIAKLQDAIKAAATDNASSSVALEGAATAETEAIVEAVAEAVVREDAATADNNEAIATQPADEDAPGPSNSALDAPPPKKASPAAMELAALSAEFPEFDKALMEGLLEDQGGDVDEVRIYLKRMVSQTAAAERKAKKGAAKAGQTDEAGPSDEGPKPLPRKRGAKEPEKNPAASATETAEAEKKLQAKETSKADEKLQAKGMSKADEKLQAKGMSKADEKLQAKGTSKADEKLQAKGTAKQQKGTARQQKIKGTAAEPDKADAAPPTQSVPQKRGRKPAQEKAAGATAGDAVGPAKKEARLDKGEEAGNSVPEPKQRGRKPAAAKAAAVVNAEDVECSPVIGSEGNAAAEEPLEKLQAKGKGRTRAANIRSADAEQNQAAKLEEAVLEEEEPKCSPKRKNNVPAGNTRKRGRPAK